MATFTIDSDNNITGYAPGEAVPDNDSEQFTTESELAQLAAQWPAARLVEVWNSIPGLAPVRKFTSRKTAVARIWKAAQSLVSGPNAPDVRTKSARSKKRRVARFVQEVTMGVRVENQHLVLSLFDCITTIGLDNVGYQP